MFYDQVIQHLKDTPPNPTIVLAQNILDYAASGKASHILTESLVVAPFSKCIYVEYAIPGDRPSLRMDVGIWMRWVDVTDSVLKEYYDHGGRGQRQDARWLIDASIATSTSYRKIGMFGGALTFVQDNGHLYGGEISQGIVTNPIFDDPRTKVTARSVDYYAVETYDDMVDHIGKMIHVAYLAVSFLHCKNVELVDHHRPDKLSRKHQKKHGVPLCEYKTINVYPLRASMRSLPSQSPKKNAENIEPTVIHSVAGHFKDFRNGKGLFGKHKEVFWWDSFDRGNEESGSTSKEYHMHFEDHENNNTNNNPNTELNI